LELGLYVESYGFASSFEQDLTFNP
jgi:hypothetical protein